MKSRLSPLQHSVLQLLKDVEPRWTLTGGGALVGFYLGHRTTEDLDLFFSGSHILGQSANEVRQCLLNANLSPTDLHTSPGFRRFSIQSDDETLVIDLVADPVPHIAPPIERDGLLIDSPHEILVNKLCALLSRSEPRDLVDVGALVAHGEDLQRAIADAPKKDGGFSPPTLAWVLESFSLASSARLGFDPTALEATKAMLIQALLSPS